MHIYIHICVHLCAFYHDNYKPITKHCPHVMSCNIYPKLHLLPNTWNPMHWDISKFVFIWVNWNARTPNLSPNPFFSDQTLTFNKWYMPLPSLNILTMVGTLKKRINTFFLTMHSIIRCFQNSGKCLDVLSMVYVLIF
jgi:hypothetical protein